MELILKNSSKKVIELCIEPDAEYYDILPNQEILILFRFDINVLRPFEIEYYNDSIIISRDLDTNFSVKLS